MLDSSLLVNLGKELIYNPTKPLLFNSVFFLFFFAFLLLFYQFILQKTKVRTWYLMLFSMYFYYKTSGIFVLLLVVTAFVNFIIGSWIHRSEEETKRKWLLIASVVWNLGTLGYYKYTNFLIDNVNQLFSLQLNFQNIILPVGISFFTFQTMSYTIDVYRKHLEPVKSFADFCFFVAFFPQLVAGPIVRATWFIPQIHQVISLNKEQIGKALILIIAGLFKKGVIADYISINFVDRVFDNPTLFTGVENLLAVYGYALQIYCDFSGYSDIAIGLATFMGFSLPVNFNTPYRSINVTEFWRRWHISLSTWLKDYLYISLGGNRKGKFRQNVNLMVTMLLGGLWHGASWNFVAWGGMHGIALVIDKLFLSLKLKMNRFTNLISGIITFHFVCFCWIFFRAKTFSAAWQVITQIFSNFNGQIFWQWLTGYPMVAALILIGYIVHFTPSALMDWWEEKMTYIPLVGQALVLTFVIWLVVQARSAGVQPFIYFQF